MFQLLMLQHKGQKQLQNNDTRPWKELYLVVSAVEVTLLPGIQGYV
jgi:hypothetical protein